MKESLVLLALLTFDLPTSLPPDRNQEDFLVPQKVKVAYLENMNKEQRI
jgi:hypothetical protein